MSQQDVSKKRRLASVLMSIARTMIPINFAMLVTGYCIYQLQPSSFSTFLIWTSFVSGLIVLALLAIHAWLTYSRPHTDETDPTDPEALA
jgi:NADH:ubiquinone oxidoreductase subunit K